LLRLLDFLERGVMGPGGCCFLDISIEKGRPPKEGYRQLRGSQRPKTGPVITNALLNRIKGSYGERVRLGAQLGLPPIYPRHQRKWRFVRRYGRRQTKSSRLHFGFVETNDKKRMVSSVKIVIKR